MSAIRWSEVITTAQKKEAQEEMSKVIYTRTTGWDSYNRIVTEDIDYSTIDQEIL